MTTAAERLKPGLDPDTDRGRAEWLLTNGLGGFAMGTLPGVNRRRYHGLLVAATAPPVDRRLLVHSAVEQIVTANGGDERVVDLSTQAFGDGDLLHPDGWTRLVDTAAEPPHDMRWTWCHEGRVRVDRALHLRPGRNAIELRYAVTAGDEPLLLRVRLLTPLRDFHSLDRASDGAPMIATRPDGAMLLKRDDIVASITTDAGTLRAEPEWWRDVAYAVDRDRGQGWREDVWSPGCVEMQVDAGATATMTVGVALESHCGLEPIDPPEPDDAPDAALSHVERLTIAAEQFLVRRAPDGTASVIAGYPWFGDWGRDALISLPGLCLATGRARDAASILTTFAAHMKGGLLPNLFDDRGGPPRYNAADAPLWYVHAAWRLARHDPALITDVHRTAVRSIIDAYRAGTDHGIGVDEDGLVVADDGDTPITWMDARRNGITFTPRRGKPVELSALWYHALCCLPDLIDDESAIARARADAERTRRSFEDRFWWAAASCCHDVLVRGDDGSWTGDGRLRPNQIFAVSLPDSPLAPARQAAVVSTVESRLATPFGLRTLDRAHREYRGRFSGGLDDLDAAYHQGTVWPWLMGPFVEAQLRIAGFAPEARRAARQRLGPLMAELETGCIGQIAEVYDGDAPHRPGGCPAQAWSVAELLRVWTIAAGMP